MIIEMEIVYKELTNTIEDYNALVDFLRKVDADFRVPLSSKCSIEQYAHKLIENGHVIAFFDVNNNSILSARGFYCNDLINKTAYGTMMSSLPEARGMGLAKNLILKMFEICEANGMSQVILCSVNPIAIHLYKSLGYEVISSTEENGISTVKLSYKLLK